MTLGIVSTLWRRPALTEMFLRYWASMRIPGVRFRRAAAIDPGDDQVHVRGWKYVESENAPDRLTDRWIAAAQALRGVDAMLVVGSDDFIDPGYVTRALELIKSGAQVVVPTSIYFMDATSGSVMRARGSRIGAGRMISRYVLEKTDYAPWMPGTTRCDGAMDDRLVRFRYTPLEGEVILDVKTNHNMWDFGYVKRIDHFEVDTEGFMRSFPSLSTQQFRGL